MTPSLFWFRIGLASNPNDRSLTAFQRSDLTPTERGPLSDTERWAWPRVDELDVSSTSSPSHLYMETNMEDKKLAQWIAANNIAQFHEQIKSETDDSMRKVLVELLAREEDKYKATLASK